MNKEQHISENQLIGILNKRMDEYYNAITGDSFSDMRGAYIKIAQRINIQKVKDLTKKSKLYDGEFWGYGINSVSDGNEIHSTIDVEDFKKIQDLNKHHHDQRFLWLLTFKVDSESLFVSIFCIDTAIFRVNSNLNSKYDLTDFQNARVRTRGNVTYVDFIFKNLEKPIHFQIDSYAQGGKLNGEQMAEYYVNQITEKTEIVKQNNKFTEKFNSEIKLVEEEVDSIELKLRAVFVDTLEKASGKKNYQEIITGKPKSDLRRRIKQHVNLHPKENVEDYDLLKDAVDFADIEHLKLLIIKDANWQYFKSIFKTKEATEKYFNQLSQLRHTLKHSRKMTELVKLEGKASLEWFNQVV